MRRALLTASSGIVLPAIGAAFMGGYYAGIIDTTKGNINAADYFQTGQRFAVIVAGKALQVTSKAYKTTSDAAPAQASTRWNGQGATAAMNSASYPAAQYCAGLTYPSDGGSPWYLPAMDEMELVYRNLKCSTEANSTYTDTASTFPGGSQASGYNPSSDPTGAAYTASVPAQTSVAAFKTGGAQALGASGTVPRFWTATEWGGLYAWFQDVSGADAGRQANAQKTSATSTYTVRPVRRVLL